MVIRERANLGSPTTKQLTRHFQNIQLARSSETISESFVEASMLIEKKVFPHQQMVTVLTKWDAAYGLMGPLNSVYKLEVVIQKCKTPENILWALRY